MGKNSALRTLGKRIGNVVLHKMLIKYTNKPESKHHLEHEEITYRDSAIKDAKEYNWSNDDINELNNVALKFLKDKSVKKYPDVTFPMEETKKLVEKEIEGMKLIK